MKQQNTSTISVWRMGLVGSMVAIAGVFLAWRALSIQVLDNEFLQNQGDARHLRTIALPAHRGMILDRQGEPLAVSTPVASIWANPQDIPLDNQNLSKLAKLLGLSLSELKSGIKQRHGREFIYLKRHVAPQVEEQVLALKIPGVSSQREYRRYYPAAEVTSQILGFTNIDDQGLEGLELMFDDKLRGVPGKQRVVKDRLGHIVDSIDLIEAPQPGRDVQLSIDRRLQYIAYRELKSAVQMHNAKSGSMVLLDAKTGEVLAMVNQPSFNPNSRAHLSTEVTRNRAVTDQFEPGSTIKPVTVAAALRSGQFNVESVIDTSPGYYRVGNAVVSDFRNYGQLDITHVIQKSSNIGVSKMALAIPKEMLWETFSDLGVGEPVNSGFPGESSGRLPFFGEWNNVETSALSYGYGLTVTPLQLARVYSIFANDGKLKPTSYVKLDHAADGERVLDENIAKHLRTMMETVVSREGTAYEAAVHSYRVAGKTGTVKVSGEGGYLEKKYRSVFAGLAPASNPRLVAVVVVEEPSGKEYYGGKVAAPIFANVMAAAMRVMNIPPDDIPTEQLHQPLQMARAGLN
ncbi:MAG: penicillin-binding transpeptidase domain-containing protein [Gammaproteobacteria bacterium]|nr:penicillin-binding transpeptidase domain-containing protein [Gammaproteobacteria bacterium]